MADLDVTLTVTPMTELEEPAHEWCEPCAKPSLLSWQYAVEANGHLFDGRLTTFSVCADCGAESWHQ